MEIIKRYKNSTLWQNTDAEGRKIYCRNNNIFDNMPKEPSNGWVYSKKQANEICIMEVSFNNLPKLTDLRPRSNENQ